MKHTLFILALITASIQTFAQSPRIKLNQITKDSLTGSVLISSPTDSGMVYSRDLFISYGADTVLILGGDTLAATSSIINSVLSDGVTITGDGTLGSELTVDTATVIATKQDLDLYYLDSNPDGYTSNTGTVTSVGGTGTVNGISLSGTVTSTGNLTLGGTLSGVDLASQVTGTLPVASGGTGSATQNFVDLTTTQTVGGAKTFTSTVTGTRFDPTSSSTTGNGMFLPTTNTLGFSTNGSERMRIDASGNLGLGITPGMWNIANTTALQIKNLSIWVLNDISVLYNNSVYNSGNKYIINGYASSYAQNATTGNHEWFTAPSGTAGNAISFTQVMTLDSSGRLGIGATSPSVQLELSTDGAKKLTTTTWATGSDRRIKKNIINYDKGLNEIIKLNPVEYELNGKANTINGAKGIGLIAQEVQPIIPEAVTGYYGKLNEDDEFDSYLYNINTHSFFFMFINAFKEQQAMIESQSTEIEQLKSQIQLILTEIEQIKNN